MSSPAATATATETVTADVDHSESKAPQLVTLTCSVEAAHGVAAARAGAGAGAAPTTPASASAPPEPLRWEAPDPVQLMRTLQETSERMRARPPSARLALRASEACMTSTEWRPPALLAAPAAGHWSPWTWTGDVDRVELVKSLARSKTAAGTARRPEEAELEAAVHAMEGVETCVVLRCCVVCADPMFGATPTAHRRVLQCHAGWGL